MQGWHYGKGRIYYRPANTSANKINLPQGQSYTDRKTKLDFLRARAITERKYQILSV